MYKMRKPNWCALAATVCMRQKCFSSLVMRAGGIWFFFCFDWCLVSVLIGCLVLMAFYFLFTDSCCNDDEDSSREATRDRERGGVSGRGLMLPHCAEQWASWVSVCCGGVSICRICSVVGERRQQSAVNYKILHQIEMCVKHRKWPVGLAHIHVIFESTAADCSTAGTGIWEKFPHIYRVDALTFRLHTAKFYIFRVEEPAALTRTHIYSCRGDTAATAPLVFV